MNLSYVPNEAQNFQNPYGIYLQKSPCILFHWIVLFPRTVRRPHVCLACIYHVTMKTSSASGNVLTTYSPAVTMFGVVGSRSTGTKQTATVSSGVRQHAALSVLFAIQTYPYFLYERENVQWAYSQVSMCSALEYAILCYSCVCTFVYKYI